jgi:hypothetical protein
MKRMTSIVLAAILGLALVISVGQAQEAKKSKKPAREGPWAVLAKIERHMGAMARIVIRNQRRLGCKKILKRVKRYRKKHKEKLDQLIVDLVEELKKVQGWSEAKKSDFTRKLMGWMLRVSTKWDGKMKRFRKRCGKYEKAVGNTINILNNPDPELRAKLEAIMKR